MESTIVGMEDKVDELLAVLDEDIRHVREALSRLDELRSLVIKRDEAALGRLLETIGNESDSYCANGLKRQSLREELAAASGCSVAEMTLSRLEAMVAGEKQVQVAQRKAELRSLTEKLKREHLKTTVLLSDCARFNSALLRGVLELGRTGAVTYSPDGATKHQTDTIFVSLQF
jgi:flagellar biosynthesis/type III secretory pathway chaperone